MSLKGLEFTKWCGVFCMLYDHLDAFAGWPLPFAQAIGSAGLPFFVVALGAAVNDCGTAKLVELVRRFLVVGIIAQVAVLFVRDGLPLNILFTFISGILVVMAVESESSLRIAALGISGVALGIVSEYSFLGTALVVASMLYYRRGVSPWWIVGASLPLYVFNEGHFFAPFSVLASVWLVENGPRLPRFRRGFYPIYVLQFPLLRFL